MLENGNKRAVYEKIINEPGEKLVEVTGIVKEFQKRKIPTELIKDSKGNVHYKDGYDHIIDYDVEMVEKAHISGEKVRPFYFVGRWTLIIDAHIGNEVIGDGHIWLVEDLGNAIQARENDRVLIKGHVVRYNKHRGKETDYCVRPISIKILN